MSVPLVSNHIIASPLRYPGGKTVLSGYVASLIRAMGLECATYVEPYAGGAGTALALLAKGVVSDIVINDYDENVFAFWDNAVNNSSAFLKLFDAAEPTMDEWDRQRRIIRHPDSSLDLGFAFFFLNRTNRSGVINGGVIGGLNQEGRYKVSARYNKPALREKLVFLGGHADSIDVRGRDGSEVIGEFASRGNTFVYADPPYVEKGKSLYLNAFTERQHRDLSKVLNLNRSGIWMLTYDDTQLIRGLYGDSYGGLFSLQYSAASRREANELMIFSDSLGRIA